LPLRANAHVFVCAVVVQTEQDSSGCTAMKHEETRKWELDVDADAEMYWRRLHIGVNAARVAGVATPPPISDLQGTSCVDPPIRHKLVLL